MAACIAALVTPVHAQPAEPAAPPPAAPVAPVPETPTPVTAPPEVATTPPAADPTPPAAAVPATPQPVEPSIVVVEPATPAPAPEADPLVGGVKFKAGKGVDIKSADGSYALNLKLKGQLLDEFQFPGAEGKPDRNYFIVRRMRLAFAGNVFTKEIKYKIEVTFAGQELSRAPVGVSGATPATMGGAVTTARDVVGQVPLLDLYLDFVQLRDLSLRVGQFKPMYGRERVLSDSDLQTVDRSLADQVFNIDRDVGLEFRSLDLGGLDKLRYYLGIYAAEERNAGLTTLGTGDFGYLYLARLELLPMGSFEETPVDFARTTPKLSFGLAYAFLQSDITSPYAVPSAGVAQPSGGAPAIVDYNVNNFTADFLFKASGFSALGSFHYRKASDLPEDVVGADGLGVALQAQYLISKALPLGISGNYSMVRRVGDEEGNLLVERSEAGGGLSYYFYEHALKLEGEFEHTWYEPVGDEDAAKPDNRLRVQLSFIL